MASLFNIVKYMNGVRKYYDGKFILREVLRRETSDGIIEGVRKEILKGDSDNYLIFVLEIDFMKWSVQIWLNYFIIS